MEHRYGLQAETHDLPKKDTFELMPKAIVNSLDPSLPKMFRSLCNDVGQTIIYEKGMQLELGIWLMKLLTPPQEWYLKSELSAAEVSLTLDCNYRQAFTDNVFIDPSCRFSFHILS